MTKLARSFDDALKRTMDVAVAAALLPALVVPFAAIGVALKLDSPGPVFYRGQRIGRGGKPFALYKFRTMVPTAGAGPTSTGENDPRITRVGRFLRKYKLDELPQFINVLVGDMSVVGPRPQVPWAVERFTEDERAVLSVRPGITDFASIRFHNEGEILAASGIADPDEAYLLLIHPEKTRLQLDYVRRRNVLVDLGIVLETAETLVRTRAYGAAEAASGATTGQAGSIAGTA